MTTTRPGIWRTAFGAIGDALQGFRDVPRPYVVVLIVSALTEFIVLPFSLDPDAEIHPLTSLGVLGFMLISMFLLISPYIGLVRYFLYGDLSAGFEPRGPVLRIVKWMAILGLASAIYLTVVGTIGILGGSHAIFSIVLAAAGILSFWAYLRLTTFLVALALDEPVSLRERFAETKGSVWFILGTTLASSVVLVPYVLATVLLQLGIFGVDSFANEATAAPSLGQRLLDALLTGVLGAAYFAYVTALYVRIFRAVPAN